MPARRRRYSRQGCRRYTPESASRNPQSAIRNPQSPIHGFTLVEMIVALAVLMVIMSGLALLFTGNIRAVQEGYLALEAYEAARASMTVLEEDLVTGFAAQDYDETFNFYGCPIGMTFIAVTRDKPDSDTIGLARVTYVVYNDQTPEEFPEALEHAHYEYGADGYPIVDPDGGNTVTYEYLTGYAYPLIRYVEPGIGRIDVYPLDLELPDGRSLNDFMEDYVDEAIDLEEQVRSSSLSGDILDQFITATKCECWIRLMAGDLSLLPEDTSFWGDVLDRDPSDYVLVQNVLSKEPPAGSDQALINPWDSQVQYGFFSYDYRYEDRDDYAVVLEDDEHQVYSLWWNDPRHHYPEVTTAKRSGNYWFDEDRLDVRLPGIVEVRFWLMLEARNVGSPDFRRLFAREIHIPSAYSYDSDEDDNNEDGS